MKFPGYASLNGPETLCIGTFKVNSPEDYNLFHRMLVFTTKSKVWETEILTKAYVNHGRWIAMCGHCQTGMLTRPDWGIANCCQCGAHYAKGSVVFPSNVAEIEQVLCARPSPLNQNWDDLQTVDDLLRENREELHL